MDVRGKKGLILGIANSSSLAYGCASVLRKLGAELAITYRKSRSEEYVLPLKEELGCNIFKLCDVQNMEDLDSLFAEIKSTWGSLDFLIHSIAFSPLAALKGRVVDTTAEDFSTTMDISCHSLIRLAKCAEPLMTSGGSIITLSYYGSEKVVQHYGIMGVAKAALESAVRYMAAELGEKGIRVNAISPGPVKTRAASAIDDFSGLLSKAKDKSPLHSLVDLEDVGNMSAFLVSGCAKNITGGVHYVDAGYHSVD
ncbi:enoyl-[acyl-carrier-protein] reductase FabI [Rickettsiales endosymbiont of Peranema trichophorum]|nr:enoyl-[acyl-carrier-protein] reductase FabI [Rickettsiales endosymbiont of Peranema trichophorum]